jgi:transposase
MSGASIRSHAISTARRALIVQRVLVDGWTTAQAATTFGVSKSLVDLWVADYRRHGMMSLRRAAGGTLTAKIVQLTVSRRVREAASKMARGFRRFFVAAVASPPLPLRRFNDDRLGGE